MLRAVGDRRRRCRVPRGPPAAQQGTPLSGRSTYPGADRRRDAQWPATAATDAGCAALIVVLRRRDCGCMRRLRSTSLTSAAAEAPCSCPAARVAVDAGVFLCGCSLRFPDAPANGSIAAAIGDSVRRPKRGTQESNLALRFWRPPCYRYTSPPVGSGHCTSGRVRPRGGAAPAAGRARWHGGGGARPAPAAALGGRGRRAARSPRCGAPAP
jgi:hypothetical protein